MTGLLYGTSTHDSKGPPDMAATKGRTTSRNSVFGCPRYVLGNRLVYITISARARGLSVGVNMNPDRYCNFDCTYCEVDRSAQQAEAELNVAVMATELHR